jgi:hypothetical protein
MSSRTASCTCGQLRVRVDGEPLGVGVCHCLACQQRTGSVFAALASFPAPNVSVYDCRRHPWVQLPPGITRFDKDPV